MNDEERLDWERVRKLARRVFKRSEPLELNDETHALLSKGARWVAISSEDAEDALRSVSTATTLLGEIRRRIRDGSLRASKVDSQVDRLREQGDFVGARKELEAALAVEVVPYYREQLENRLEHLATLETIYSTGHVEADFHPWEQLRALALRVQQGKGLELRDDLRDFLRRIAPSVAIDEVEVEQALRAVESTEALLANMLGRIEGGRQRITQALNRMFQLQESGDREGALQPLRDVLAVEVVPQYRQMAEEWLTKYDELSLDE